MPPTFEIISRMTAWTRARGYTRARIHFLFFMSTFQQLLGHARGDCLGEAGLSPSRERVADHLQMPLLATQAAGRRPA